LIETLKIKAMKLKMFIMICVLFIQHNILHSQNSAYTMLNTGNINARISANGHHFCDMMAIPMFEVPIGSQNHTLFCNTLWIGGLNSGGQLHLSAERYRQYGADYTLGPLSIDGLLTTDQLTIDYFNRVWVVSRSEIDDHIEWYNNPAAYPGYVVPDDILEWPAHGDTTKNQSFFLAPFFDVNGNGVYEPLMGDYPIIKGDKAVFFIFNDAGIPNSESGGNPLGIEVHGMAYMYDCSQTIFNNVLYMHYEIFNRSNNTYSDTYLGLFTDFDIGYAFDDYIGCDVHRGSIFGYNGTPIDGTGLIGHYGANPPAQSLTILAGPYMDTDGADNPKYDVVVDPVTGDTSFIQICNESINGINFGNGIEDDERYGLRYFTAMNGAGEYWATTDPSTPIEYYNYLQGIWRDGSRLQWGAFGHPHGGATFPNADFMFSGDSDPCHWGTGGVVPSTLPIWTEETAANTPYDRRGVASMGPFTFHPGTSQLIDFAFVWGRSGDGAETSVDVMKRSIDSVRYYFLNSLHPCPYQGNTSLPQLDKPEEFQFTVFPNPTEGAFYVETDFVGEMQCQLFDVAGNLVVNMTNYHNMSKICISHLSSGVYILQIKAKNDFRVFKIIKQ
jgi:hypothetical protein